jgi:hypothetical protein
MFIEVRINRRRILSVGTSDPAYDLGRRVFAMPVWHVHVAEKVLETRADPATPMSSQRWNREGEPIAAARLSCECARGGVFEGRALCRSDIAGEDAEEGGAGLAAANSPTGHSKVVSSRMVNLRMASTVSMASLRAASNRTTRISASMVVTAARANTADSKA